MYMFILVFHIVVVASLMGIILIQRGRSGGLVESLSGVESVFGTKTSSVFVKITVVLVILFFCTSISLAYLSKARGKSLMDKYQDFSLQDSLPLPGKEVKGNTSQETPEEKAAVAVENDFSSDVPESPTADE